MTVLHDDDAPQSAARRQIRTLRVGDLVLADAPRFRIDEAYVHDLATAERPWPPIVVHHPSYRVVDGVHRVRAAVLRGQSSIEAIVITAPESEIMALAIAANAAHGRELSVEDRKRAAHRLLIRHPEWSSRRIAKAACLAPGTVEKLRPALLPGEVRIGLNGRTHSLRTRSDPAGTSPIRRPVARLRADATLTQSPAGRRLVGLFGVTELDPREWFALLRAIPPHCVDAVTAAARDCASAWQTLADATELRHRRPGPG